MKNTLKKIIDLSNYLNDRTKEYDEGHPTISDKEWDAKYFELIELEKKYDLKIENSPTQSIPYMIVNSLKKVEHNHEMLSLEKTKSLSEVKDFLQDYSYIAMCKMDGLTCSLEYKNGELISAETRGNGIIGEDILHNALMIPSIPKLIPYKENLVVDGEVICTYNDFNQFEDNYKNPRNFASGSIRLLDSRECFNRHLTFVAWDIIKGFEDDFFLHQKFSKLIELNFTVVPYVINYSLEESLEKIKEMAKNESYPIDGVVYKFDDIAYGKTLGKTAHHFKNAIAYKFYDETYTSYLKDIEWTMGRTGVLTPIAVFDPIEIEGSIVSRASLHNVSIMEETLGIPYKDQKLEIFKANMIIPQIYSAEKLESPLEDKIIGIPYTCPYCGDIVKVVINNNTKTLLCNNDKCGNRFINQLNHFCGKQGLDIKGLSKATLEKLINWNWVSKIEDLFNLKQYAKEWKKKSGFGEKSVEKILTAIEASKSCEFYQFLSAIGIPLIGVTASKDLAKHFKTWTEFINSIEKEFKFYELPNFGIEMHNAIINFDYTEAKKLYQYLSFKESTLIVKNNQKLNNLNIVITGKLKHFKNRDELKAIIETNGGKVITSVSSKTNYLINNDIESTSSKNLTAKKLGVSILTEEDFIKTFSL